MAAPQTDYVARPFEGLPGETDWVALRELVPAATATVRTTAEHGARDVVVTTALPDSWPALHRQDGTVLLALQTRSSTGDASRDLASVLLEALTLEPGTPVQALGLPTPGPRLQDVLDLDAPFEVEMRTSFDYWLDESTEQTAEVKAALEEADSSIIPTVRLSSVASAYWTRMAGREFVRWVQPLEEQAVLDGLSRLHARRASGFGGAKFVGYFRACGLVVPVWELARGTEAAEVDDQVAAFAPGFAAAVADDEPLDADARRARAGLVARQVTLR
ncbi:MAG TPA: DUF5926 family protein [Cellulomonas sp.]